jgi:ABC-type transport system involved in cytochrome c biogenesis permease subunit
MQITCVLLLGFFFLTLVGTLIQGSRGLWWAQQEIFHTWIARLPLTADFSLPFPGVMLLGAVAIVNLSAALLVRIPWKWRNSGLLMMHAALLLLLISGAVIYQVSQESYLKLAEGQKKSWSSHSYRWELALQQRETQGFYTYTIPLPAEDSLAQRNGWPKILIRKYEENARVLAGNQILPFSSRESPEQWTPALQVQVSDGNQANSHILTPENSVLPLGETRRLVLRRHTWDLPFAVELVNFEQEKHHGTMIASSYHSRVKVYPQGTDEFFAADISMNHPLRMGVWTLYQSSYATWQGKEFSILAVVKNPVKIWPWYATILMGLAMLLHMSVRILESRRKKRILRERHIPPKNLGWVLLCALMVTAVNGAWNPAEAAVQVPEAFRKHPVWHQGRLKPLESYSRHILLQISGKSTVKVPDHLVESVTPKNSVRQGAKSPKLKLQLPSGHLTSEEWLFVSLFYPEQASQLPLVLIESPQLRDALGLSGKERDRYTWQSLRNLRGKADTLAMMAQLVPQSQQAPWQQESMRLAGVLRLLESLENSLAFLRPESMIQPVPAHADAPWDKTPQSFWEFVALGHPAALFTDSLMNVSDSLLTKEDQRYLDWLEGTLVKGAQWSQAQFRVFPLPSPSGLTWESPGHLLFLSGFQNPQLRKTLPLWNDVYQQRSGAADSLLRWVRQYAGNEFRYSAIKSESVYHRLQPFYKAMVLYFLALIPGLIFAMGAGMRHRVMWLSLLLAGTALVLHLIGMGLRVHISLRPPVTNLYETFVFVGAVMVFLFLGVFWRLRWKGAPALAAFSGAALLLIARRHGVDGDTMPVLAAVLDSNFWLSIHVITISLGYGGVLAAGAAAHLYLWNPAKTEAWKATRGLLAFGLLLTFVGTLLGGIWADQSWGRFWGWDPKENGALLIVLWCAFAFHGMPAGWFKKPGFSLAAVGAIPVVLFAWFGVNLMGVGLHSYGFTTGTMWGLIWYGIAELLFVVVALIRIKRLKLNSHVRT